MTPMTAVLGPAASRTFVRMASTPRTKGSATQRHSRPVRRCRTMISSPSTCQSMRRHAHLVEHIGREIRAGRRAPRPAGPARPHRAARRAARWPRHFPWRDRCSRAWASVASNAASSRLRDRRAASRSSARAAWRSTIRGSSRPRSSKNQAHEVNIASACLCDLEQQARLGGQAPARRRDRVRPRREPSRSLPPLTGQSRWTTSVDPGSQRLQSVAQRCPPGL